MQLGMGISRSASPKRGVEVNRYTLIDGAFFEKFCRSIERATGVGIFDVIDWEKVASGSSRLIYYDALPVKKDSQSDAHFEAEMSRKAASLDKIRASVNCHVRDGLTRLRTEKRKSEISQRREQKGVDTWIAVDAMQYALNGVVDELIVFTSDLDLYPLFEALQSTKCKGRLRFQEGRAAPELIHAADIADPLSINNLHAWTGLSRLRTLRELGRSSKIIGERIFEATSRNGLNAAVTKVPGEDYYYGWIEHRNDGWLGYHASNSFEIVDRLRVEGVPITYNSIAGA